MTLIVKSLAALHSNPGRYAMRVNLATKTLYVSSNVATAAGRHFKEAGDALAFINFTLQNSNVMAHALGWDIGYARRAGLELAHTLAQLGLIDGSALPPALSLTPQPK
ncbi:MAG: hypothetical protein JWO78_665 [Micavibrio sp.]|nr:hypothetical protein [Micavibrio sp.]